MTSPDALFERFQTPPPPADLRARSLTAARLAMARSGDRIDLWTRLSKSLAARLAWAAAVGGLVLAHAILSFPTQPAPPPRESPLLLAGAAPDPELGATVTLPRLRSGRLPQLDPSIRSEPAHPAGETTPRSDGHDA